ncbi:MAG: hypothetical protein U9N45_04420 [Gemmatimonadota bacterium]|nr:hypothetical protein [Gemmatimonadota bacterium]
MVKKIVYLLMLACTWATCLHGYTMNARAMGMGGAFTTGRSLTAVNPAYHAVARARDDARRVIPIPLGLVKFAVASPEFDPDKDDFDAVKIANLLFHPPLDLELISPPGTKQADILINLGYNNLMIDLRQARETIPDKGTDYGVALQKDFRIIGMGNSFISVSPLLFFKNELELGDNLSRVLRDALPFDTNSRYRLNNNGEMIFGFSMGMSHARKVYSFEDAPEDSRDGVYLGGTVKYILGLAYAEQDGWWQFRTHDPLFGETYPMETESHNMTRISVPGEDDSGSVGHGLGLDMGFSVIRGAWEFGAGARNLVSSVKWKVHEEVREYDDETNEFHLIHEATHKSISASLPVTAAFNICYRPGERYRVAAAVRKEPRGICTHLGAEFDALPWVVLRGGVFTDSQNTFQVSGGLGLKKGRFGFDMALATNNANLSRDKGLSLYTSIALY